MIKIEKKVLQILIDNINWDFALGDPEVEEAVAKAQEAMDKKDD